MAQNYKETESEENGIYTFTCEGMVLGELIKYKSQVGIGSMEYDMRLDAIKADRTVEESVELLNEIPEKIELIKKKIRWENKRQFLKREDLIHKHNESVSKE